MHLTKRKLFNSLQNEKILEHFPNALLSPPNHVAKPSIQLARRILICSLPPPFETPIDHSGYVVVTLSCPVLWLLKGRCHVGRLPGRPASGVAAGWRWCDVDHTIPLGSFLLGATVAAQCSHIQFLDGRHFHVSKLPSVEIASCNILYTHEDWFTYFCLWYNLL